MNLKVKLLLNHRSIGDVFTAGVLLQIVLIRLMSGVVQKLDQSLTYTV